MTKMTASEFRAACLSLEMALDSVSASRPGDEREREIRRADRALERLQAAPVARKSAADVEWRRMLISRALVARGNRVAAEMFA